ncbi:MAG: crossover junction endodeoxyribonuclease RuvC [Myxococcota bacterium]
MQARILGIDPGSQVTGYGVVERRDGELVHVAHGTLRASKEQRAEQRLDALYRALLEVIEQHRPEMASVEQLFVARGARSALVLGQARGVALAAIGRAGLALHEYAPSRIKQSVAANGRASKLQVQRAVKRMLSLQKTPASDAADALAAALCHANAGRLAALGVRPRPRRRPTARGPVVRVRRAP